MISISQAIASVKNNVKPLLEKTIKKVEKAGGYILFEDIKSPINMPPFRQSAMDGYALNIHEKLTYTVVGEIKAGDLQQLKLKTGEAARIFTGAPVPSAANAVVMQEKVVTHNNGITLDNKVPLELNIRPLGEQVRTGDIALKKGCKLTPAAIGYLISLGITEVSVFKKPNIAIVTTGNELVEAGQVLPYGKIFESNSKMLLSALYNLKYYDVTLYKVEDDFNKTVTVLSTALSNNDLVLITGGISVGDYDFVGQALKALHVETCFYKVKQKPGKPLFYGKKDNSHVFALPGNPAAALTCFYNYVYIALQIMMNRNNLELERIAAKSISNFIKKGDRPQFLKAIYKNGFVEILEGQSSSMLQTFALSNALIYAPEEVTTIKKGDELSVIILPS